MKKKMAVLALAARRVFSGAFARDYCGEIVADQKIGAMLVNLKIKYLQKFYRALLICSITFGAVTAAHAKLTTNMVDTCLFNKWEFVEVNANSFYSYLHCVDFTEQTRPYRFFFNTVNRAEKMSMQNAPLYSAGHIWSVGFRTSVTRRKSETPQTLLALASENFGAMVTNLTYLMTIQEYEKEYGKVKLMRPKQMDDSKPVQVQTTMRAKTLADVMDEMMRAKKTADIRGLMGEPHQVQNLGKYVVWSWNASYKDGGKSIPCKQNFVIQGNNIRGWSSDCNRNTGNAKLYGEIVSSRPIPTPVIPSGVPLE